MSKRAIITIVSKQKDLEDDAIEVVTPGEFYIEDNYYYAVYDETELSGMEGTKTKIRISENDFLLTRTGTTTGDMRFIKGNKDKTIYSTPYGVIEISINTKDLIVNMNDNGGEVIINYDMIIAGQSPQKTELKINIKA
ncbi:Uncharacterized beta-barrel protein YwiB, DUF1934 family [Clostridium sp. USBA 49]|jgi:uncharacterized beta-barrel protein YwiB (DUF1934 family)|uniref:DUF1934 domain-containing protein n=1 Tax=Clostridium TaxID=1485 RepID=UPI00099925EB|nr:MULTISPECIES: DUF1934 domain-containing protein [Clostridium]SKA81387.1 Uncharacterized beta-barrel protein YwiB, DUF1934 family [Clostridium sp. USBA 49]